MDLAIGLPNAVPKTTGAELTEWARRAEARGFSSLGTIDRIAYGNYEPLTALAGAAAVTERIGLATTVLLGPLRPNATELAKRALSLHALSDGRFTLGIGIGGREDDYSESGIEMSGRGETLDRMLDRIADVWAGDSGIGPSISGRPGLLVGGSRRRLLRARREARRRLDRGRLGAGRIRRRRGEGEIRVVEGRARGRAQAGRSRLLLARRRGRAARPGLPARLLRLARRRDGRHDRGLGRHRRGGRPGATWPPTTGPAATSCSSFPPPAMPRRSICSPMPQAL